jgi:uncharacterized protein YndB with AHSA1/START domain
VSTADSTTLRIERTIDAPAEDVFDAWTSSEVLRRWWTVDPAGTTPVADVDLRVGGEYRLTMRDSGGDTHTVRGEYRRIDRPGLLVYTWAWEQADGEPGHESTVTVRFHGQGERTLVEIEHTGLESVGSRDQHGIGWNGTLDSLQRRVFQRPPGAA